MKNILFYTDTPQIGGAELQLLLLARFLDREKFTPTLAVSHYPALDKWCARFEKEGIEVIRLKIKHKHDPRHYFQLKKIIKEKEIDLLHAHVWNPASCRYAFGVGIPIVTTEHDPFKLNFFKNLFKKNTFKKISHIITVSEQNKNLLTGLYPKHKDKITVIHNGIDCTWWKSQSLRFTEEDRRKIKEELFQSHEDTLIITTIAELHERKGLKYLIEAVALASEKFPNIKLIIIGEGKERNALEALVKKFKIENHVSLIGKQKEVAKLLKSSDIFVLPSRREAFGLVITEAMITPLPVIASKVGGIPEIIEDGSTGFLVEAENPEDIYEKLLELIASPPLREKFAKNGYKRVLKEFDASIMAKKYEKVYESIK